MTMTERVKGVQFNFVNFLWKEISYIRDLEKSGNYARALQALCSLITYAPEGIKKEFREEAKKNSAKLRTTRGRGPSRFVQNIKRNEARQLYALSVFNDFMDRFCTTLDKRGYMEKVGPQVDEGYSHTLRR